MFPVLIMDTHLIDLYSIIRLSLKATVAKRWTGLGKLVKLVGQPAVHAMYGMERRSPEPTLGVFKECEGLMSDRPCDIVLCMSGNNRTILGIKPEIQIA